MVKDITVKDKKDMTFKEKLYVNVYDFISVISGSLVAIMIIFTFFFRIVGVNGTSMLPTLEHGDWLVTSAYDMKPQRGQIVIVTQPNYFNEPIVKRIVALENQVVDIDFTTGDVFVDGERLDEPYINNATINSEGVEFPVTVPEHHVFVMGDNRQGSTDSRSPMVGFIHEKYILGEAKYKIFKNVVNENGVKEFKYYPFAQWSLK